MTTSKNLPNFFILLLVLFIAGAIIYESVSRTAAGPSKADGRTRPAPAWDQKTERPQHTDHSGFMTNPFGNAHEVTRACLECHPESGKQVMKTSHWTWLGEEVQCPKRDLKVRLGKRNIINNFCVGVSSNWPRCTSCHVGYGWRDESFDFTNAENVDCLVCHDRTGTYKKAPTEAGYPAPDVDLLAVAQSVGAPGRANCGACHFMGGGGNAVKHGDMDMSLNRPSEWSDVHMGRHDFVCQDCHVTEDHNISCRAMSVSVNTKQSEECGCARCHTSAPHKDAQLNQHTGAVACQTCHVTHMTTAAETKVHWDWSTAGRDDMDPTDHLYNKMKGTFRYAQGGAPEYRWYNGASTHYLMGDTIDPDKVTSINHPLGDRHDPRARIAPFKVHRGKQIYDTVNKYLLVPKMFGPDGFWKTFDWDSAARLGSESSGLKYSGSYGFASTEMYWPLTHMVGPKDKALACKDCHTRKGSRLDWTALGYPGDPAAGRQVPGL